MNNKMKILTLCAMAVVLNVVLGEAVSLLNFLNLSNQILP